MVVVFRRVLVSQQSGVPMATIDNFQVRVSTQRETIKRKDIEIHKLKAALRAFTSEDLETESNSADNNPDSNIDISDISEDKEIQADDEEIHDASSDSESESWAGLPEPIWVDEVRFESEGMYICNDCAAEVVEGHCFLCGLEHEWEDDRHQKGGSTETQAIHSDRSLIPRGNTPILHLPVDKPEYKELLQRGATRLMCEEFHLEYTHDKGIFAWADSRLYEEFAGPAMKDGDFWKIHLGRRVILDNDDLDGSAFIEGLLEDALYFPLRGEASERKFEKWETLQETPGIWVTRLQENRTDEGDGDAKSEVSDEDYEQACEEDEALGDREATDNVNSINRVDEYDTEDCEEHDDDSEMEMDPGYSWQANVPDAEWKDEEVDEENSQGRRYILSYPESSDDETMADSDSESSVDAAEL